MYKAGAVDTFAPDYKTYPLFRQASCFQDVLQKGEILYYPHDYWHQTRNEASPTVSLTGTLVTPGNRAFVREELQRECDGGSRVMAADAVVCGVLPACYKFWNTRMKEEL